MLSFISIHKNNWRSHSYAASCSVSDRVLFQMLKDNPNIQKVYLCLDNDEAGQKANERISDKLLYKVYSTKSSYRTIRIGTRIGWQPTAMLRATARSFLYPTKMRKKVKNRVRYYNSDIRRRSDVLHPRRRYLTCPHL